MNKLDKNTSKNLLKEINALELNLKTADGNPAVAKANQLAAIISKIAPYQIQLPNDLQMQVTSFVRAYKAAQDGDKVYSQPIFKLIDPTKKLIVEFLENKSRDENI